MKTISIISILLIALTSLNKNGEKHGTEIKKAEKLNVIYILADDLGYGDLGCYGQQKIRTPNIDKMAAEGIKFNQFYAGSTVCAPSRSALMTGLHTGHNYIRGNGEVPLRSGDTTIAQVFKKSGYTTGMFGKWGLGLENTSGAPQKKGWDEFLGHLHHVAAHYQYTDSLWQIVNGSLQRIKIDPALYANDLFAESAKKFITAHQQEPFFLYLSLTLPHAELKVPDASLKKYQNKGGQSIFAPEIPFPEKHYGAQSMPRAAYAAMVSRVDDYVGEIRKLLKELNLEGNTILFFTSDNGPHKEGGNVPDYFNSNGPLRGIKRDLYEGGIRVPLIVSCPGKIKKGISTDHKAANWDLFTTVSEITGQNRPDNLDGVSFLPTLLGQANQKKHDYFYWEFHEQGFKQALLKNDWKAIRFYNKDKSFRTELYDLRKDVSEKNNVAGAHASTVKEMEELMDQARSRSEHPLFRTIDSD